jgi:hypothetical protein
MLLDRNSLNIDIEADRPAATFLGSGHHNAPVAAAQVIE